LLEAAREDPRQSQRNLVNIRAQVVIEEFAAAERIVIDAENDPANLAPPPPVPRMRYNRALVAASALQ
jgi:hypothetical protein